MLGFPTWFKCPTWVPVFGDGQLAKLHDVDPEESEALKPGFPLWFDVNVRNINIICVDIYNYTYNTYIYT